MQTGCASYTARGRTEGSFYMHSSHMFSMSGEEFGFDSECEQSLDVLSKEIPFFFWFSTKAQKEKLGFLWRSIEI